MAPTHDTIVIIVILVSFIETC